MDPKSSRPTGLSSKDNMAFMARLRDDLATTEPTALYPQIVNAPFTNKLLTTHLGLGLIALVLADKDTKTIRGIALSDTRSELGAIEMSSRKFEEVSIPLYDPENAVAKAIRSGKPQQTSNWYYLFAPVFSGEQARFIQSGLGIACSIVYPLTSRATGGALVFSYFKELDTDTEEQEAFMNHYTAVVSEVLSLNNTKS